MKDLKMYINGEFVESSNGKYIEVLNPSTEEVISRQPEGTIEDCERALDAARAAQKEWAKTPACERAVYLTKMAEGIRKREKEFVEIIMREQGKTRNWASIEVGATIAYFDYMASFARHIEGEIVESDNRGESILISKKPIGVVAGILPWNFPFFLIARKAGAALIAGCSIVIKPAQLTPENCCEFAKVVDETGLPKGLFNVVTGKGSVIKAAANNITKVSLELGGKAPVVVFPDADLELAAQAILDSRIGNNGQICNNAERLYLHKDIYDKMVALLTEKFKAVKVGDPFSSDDIDMGPLVEQRALESVQAKVAKAIEQGAKVIVGGNRVGNKGYFFEATLLGNCRQDMDIIHEETFGPVLPIIPFDNIEQVIDWCNDCEYGLASSVFTNDINTAARMVRCRQTWQQVSLEMQHQSYL